MRPLEGLSIAVAGPGPSCEYGAWLLRCLGANAVARGDSSGGAVEDWASSGAMALTGRADEPPLVAPGRPATAARGAMLAFEALSALAGRCVALPGHRLLGERAALAGLTRQGPWSPGRSFRFVETNDGWAGFSLPRAADLERLPALMEQGDGPEPWAALASWARRRRAAEVAERAQLLAMAACALTAPAEAATDEQSQARGQRFPLHPFLIDGAVARPRADNRGSSRTLSLRCGSPLVVDLSSLWAGPLCAHLLGLAGARVIKVESIGRPDGARSGERRFFDLLHAGHQSVALDLSEPGGRDALARLLRAADIVIESSRPRALRALGLDPHDVLEADGDRTWISITAYGRSGPWANRVGFGDDAAAAAGLAAIDPQTSAPVPCGDAIGDPLAGMHAAVAALASFLGGGSRLIDVAIRDVVGASLAEVPRLPSRSIAARREREKWVVDTEAGIAPVAEPVAREPIGAAAPLGANADSVLAELTHR